LSWAKKSEVTTTRVGPQLLLALLQVLLLQLSLLFSLPTQFRNSSSRRPAAAAAAAAAAVCPLPKQYGSSCGSLLLLLLLLPLSLPPFAFP
jgi:hypothetical protein